MGQNCFILFEKSAADFYPGSCRDLTGVKCWWSNSEPPNKGFWKSQLSFLYAFVVVLEQYVRAETT